jgi:glutamate 5-kinase
LRPSGAIAIDAGALAAVRAGKSLLPAGVTAVTGRFARGDTVSVLDRDGSEVGRGMIAYNDRDAARIIGKRSADIEALLGFRGRDEMIHRDDLVLLRTDLATA